MQTKQQIQQLLATAGVMPNHRRGQNFLIDLNLMRFLVDAADIHSNDVVLEIGCGTGSLTEALVEKAGRVIVAEIDPIMARITQRQLDKAENLQVLQTDILESKNTINNEVKEAISHARNENKGRFMLVANLPYSIASPAMINLVTADPRADAMYVTVQKEVAERMTAEPGSKHFGPLSIFLAATGDVKLLRILKPSVFWPQPQVESAMISFVRNKQKARRIHNIDFLSQVVTLFMQHRRKMLKACTHFAAGPLENIHNWSQIFDDCCVDPHLRPENLSPEHYISIANLCNEQIKRG